MEDLIEALTIFSKYSDTKWPTTCIYDVLIVMDVGEDEPSDEEQFRLEELGFFWSDEDDAWASFRFGSA